MNPAYFLEVLSQVTASFYQLGMCLIAESLLILRFVSRLNILLDHRFICQYYSADNIEIIVDANENNKKEFLNLLHAHLQLRDDFMSCFVYTYQTNTTLNQAG